MTLNQLVCRAASACPGALPMRVWDFERQCPAANAPGASALAAFVVDELHATFDPGATGGDQIAGAVRAMQAASDALADTAFALSTLSGETESETGGGARPTALAA